MTNIDLEKGWQYFKNRIKTLSVLPDQIISKANIFCESLKKDLKWSIKESDFYANLLICNGIIKYNGNFLLLTEKGYKLKNEENPSLAINLIDCFQLI